MNYPLSERFFYTLPQPLMALAIILIITLAHLAGRRVRLHLNRKAGKEDEEELAQATFITSAMIGLLALLIGFTFSMAINAYDKRRSMVVQEANAINSTYLAAQALGEPHRSRVSMLLSQYADNRIAVATSNDLDRTSSLLAGSDGLQNRLWAAALAAQKETSDASASRLVGSTQNLIETGLSRLAVREPFVPMRVHTTLLLFVAIAAFSMGFAFVGGTRRATTVLLILFTLTLVLIIDVERPTRGLVLEPQNPIERVKRSMRDNPPAEFDRLMAGDARQNAEPR